MKTENQQNDNSKYQEELKKQKWETIAENPERAWMIEEAYRITLNPYRKPRRKSKKF